MQNNTRILGIDFSNENVHDFFIRFSKDKGLLTVPSGPGLASIPKEPDYYNSLLNSDFVIADSGYMVLIWNLISKRKIKKLSGLTFIDHFLKHFSKTNETLFLINPSEDGQLANLKLLNSINIKVSDSDCYIAPYYNGNLVDENLIHILEEKKPQWILINLGGGVQEILGYYIRKQLSYKPAIICTGAAIAFKTGEQVKMPLWVDRIYLGWLCRVISRPKTYLPRYLSAFKLALIIIKNRQNKVI